MWGKNTAVVFMGLGSPMLCSTMKLTPALWASRMNVVSGGSFAALCIVEAFIRVEKTSCGNINMSTYKKSKANYSSLTVNFVKKNVILKLKNTMTVIFCMAQLGVLGMCNAPIRMSVGT